MQVGPNNPGSSLSLFSLVLDELERAQGISVGSLQADDGVVPSV